MYLPFIKVKAQEDRIGNLLIWRHDKNKAVYIRTSQAKSDIYANCFNFTKGDLADLQNGYEVTLELHEDYVLDLFS